MSLRNRLGFTKEPVYLIDGSAFIYRGFYAYPDLKRSDGFPTNAMLLVLRLVTKLMHEEQPAYLGFILDGKGPTFRHEMMESYKAQRMRMPENLAMQIDPLLKGLETLGITTLIADGVEADDILASLACRFKQDQPIVLIGADKDLQQCLDENVCLWDPSQKKEKLVTLADFCDKQELVPAQWPDYQALIGDKVDNIPGIPGVGPKTALGLLKRFPTLEALQEGFERLTAKEQTRLLPHMEDLFLYRELTRLQTTCCPEQTLDDFAVRSQDTSGFLDFLETYEFRSLKRDYEQQHPGEATSSDISKETDQAAFVHPLAVKALPSCTGKDVGMVVEGKSVRIALDGQEYLLPVSPSVVTALSSARSLAVPSFKEVLYHHHLWHLIPLQTWFDLGLAAYLLNPEERQYGFERLRKGLAAELDVHPDNPALAACEMARVLGKRLDVGDCMSLLRELELPLIPVLVKMEHKGIRLDMDAFTDFLAEVQDKLQQLTATIYEQAGTVFNIRSSQQLGEVLFDHLGIVSKKKTPGGKPSTSVQALEALDTAHPIIGSILQYRTLEKLRSTYLEPLPKLADREDRVHTHFNHLATATGRLSSSKPNLQNIPIRGEFGPRMRGCFVAQPGYKLVAADYSQIELRILAHMSQDPHLLDAFARKEDIHARTAALLFDKDPDEVLVSERSKAKTVNFGLLYGMGPQKLGRELGMSLKEAKAFIERYFSTLVKVRELYATVEEQARVNGYVTTIAGRRRLLPEINSRNTQLAQQARRMAINTVVQGSAADVIKKAMLAVDSDPVLTRMKASLLLQVHDELVLEVPEQEARGAGERLAAIMSTVYDLAVPLAVDWGVGDTWAEAH
ncbi:MAG: DNA polymerase I [Deltaproteobacteria bacterium]|nr:MAG: DNA polymerase I [Deltaproteobacteria bacterium]